MKELLPVFYPIAHQVSACIRFLGALLLILPLLELRDILIGEVKNGVEYIDLSRWTSRAALEYIGQGGLGYSFDALDVNKTHLYTDSMKMLVYAFSLFPGVNSSCR